MKWVKAAIVGVVMYAMCRIKPEPVRVPVDPEILAVEQWKARLRKAGIRYDA